jgi:DNA-binding CsgD family transcriptional regulator
MLALVGRDDEVRRLRELLDGSETSPSLVVLDGVSGVGKTAVLGAALDGRAARALHAHGVPWEADRDGGVLAQLQPGRGSAEERLRRAIAASPVIVVVEDAQWADAASLRLLSTLARSTPQSQVQVVLVRTTDADGVHAATADLLDGLADSTMTVLPLDGPGVAELMAAAARPLRPLVAERLAGFTGGIARHILDLARELPADLWTLPTVEFPAPLAVARRVSDRCAQLGPPARAFLEAAAVLGPNCSAAKAGALSGLDDPLPAAEEARSAGLVRIREPQSSRLLITMDPMVRRAILERMGVVARAAAHRRAAEVLSDPTGRLRHRADALSGPDASIADELDAAAVSFAARGNWATTAELLARSAGLTPERALREERTLRTIDALVGSGDALAAAALVSEVDSMAETPLHHAVLGYLAIVQGRAVEAESRLTRAWALSGTQPDVKVRAMIGQRFVLHSLARCHAREIISWADETCALVPQDAPESLEARAIRGLGLSALGDTAAAVAGYQVLESTIRGAQAQRVVMARGWIHLGVDEIDEACSELEAALPTDVLGGSLRISLWAHAWLARGHFLSGRWDEALDVARRGLDLAARSGMILFLPLLHWTTSQIHALRGEVDAAELSLRRGDARPLDYTVMRVPAALARAAAAETRGDYRGVLHALTPFASGTLGDMVDGPGFWPWADVYANALVMEGRFEEAEVFLASHEAVATERGQRANQARLAAPRGRLLAAAGDLAGARQAFDAALGLLAGLPLEHDRARLNFAYGQTLRRAGRRRDAELYLGTARELFAALGAATYVARCDRELGAPEPHGGPLTELLTGKERLVASQAAHGRSNREIASELYISEKTVQYHLTRIYAKSGVRSRAGLAAVWLDAEGDGEPARAELA